MSELDINKKALIVATTASMIDQFNRENIKILQKLGYEVHILCNFKEGNNTPPNVVEKFKTQMDEQHVTCFDYPITRAPFAYGNNLRLAIKIRKLIKQEKYKIVHCQTPVGGVVARLACAFNIHKWGGKIIYMAHGFHFFKGAPIKNWLLFFPIEWIFSWFSDLIITINKEDYKIAKKRLHAKKTEYVPGVGIDINKISTYIYDNLDIRNQYKINRNDFVVSMFVDNSNVNYFYQVVNKLTAFLNCNFTCICIASNETKIDNKLFSGDVLVVKESDRFTISNICQVSRVYIDLTNEKYTVETCEAIAAFLPLFRLYDYKKNNDNEATCVVRLVHDIVSFNSHMVKSPLLTNEKNYLYDNYKEVQRYIYNKFVQNDNLSDFDEYIKEKIRTPLARIINAESIKYKLSIPVDAFVIVSVGEVNDNKNHQVIIRTIPRLLAAGYNVYYIVCGRGPMLNENKSLAEELGVVDRVKFVGFQEDVRFYLDSADLFAFPSKREGLGLAAIEAMADSLPLVTSDSGGIKDYSRNGRTGFMKSATDVDGFTEVILEVLKNPDLRIKFGFNNRIIVNRYGKISINEKMKKIYEKLK